MKRLGGSPASSRIFLALGTLVVAVVAFRFVRGGIAALAAWKTASAASTASAAEGAASPFAFLFRHAGSLLAGALVLGALLIGLAAGVLQRRPWARPAAILFFAATGAAAAGVAVFQLSALARGAAVPAEAAEIGYGPLLSFWRIGGAVAALLIALFCAASLRRFASAEMRREFSGEPRRPL